MTTVEIARVLADVHKRHMAGLRFAAEQVMNCEREFYEFCQSGFEPSKSQKYMDLHRAKDSAWFKYKTQLDALMPDFFVELIDAAEAPKEPA